MIKKRCVAMLLAGGQGSRLGILTSNVAKPAVPFGGKYRIIDFPLSNCVNSGIDTVGVLTQYKPLELNAYIGSGAPWDLDRTHGGVFVLPPYQDTSGGKWYKGTANAIYQNIAFVERWDPEYVLVLSGDHIYKMDYSQMLQAHRRSGAAATIAVREVPWDEAPRFGIMNTDGEGNITDFEEKPPQPRSNLASMGVYVFNWQLLKDYLARDEGRADSSNDFGKDIIPAMLAAGERLCAYAFNAYWKDVGTIASLWEANMDLLSIPPQFDLYDEDWRIYSRNPVQPPHYLSPDAAVRNCIVTEGSAISGRVDHSVIFSGVRVEEGAEVVDSIVMPDAVVERGARVYRTIVAEGARVGAGAAVGEAEGAIAVVGEGALVPPGAGVPAGAILVADEA